MRILIGAMLALLLNSAYWVQFRGFEILYDYEALRDYDITKDITLLMLSAYLVIEGLLLIRRNQRQTEVALEKEEQEREFLAHELDEVNELHEKIESLQTDLHAERESGAHVADQLARLTDERDRLRTAFDDLRHRLEHQRKASSEVSDEVIHAEIVHFLSLLQQKGRFIDFVMDDVAPYSDAQVGAAARVVHQGCRSVMQQYFTIHPVHEGQEGERIELPRGTNLDRYRLVGRVVGEPPFRGTVIHRGWKTIDISLPRASGTVVAADVAVIAPAEVEVGETRSAH